MYHTDAVWTNHRSDTGRDLTHGEYIPAAMDTYVRVEIRDKNGNYAWSQYVPVR